MRNFNEEIRKMKKITALLLVLAMAVALCACGSSSSTPAADTLVMGTSADYPPYEFQYLDADGRRTAVTSQDVNDYIRDNCRAAFTSKHFRTWGGTVMAAALFGGM